MSDGVRRLGTMLRLQDRHEVEVAAVIAPMTCPAECDDAERVVAAAEASRDDVRGVDARRGATSQTAPAGNLGALCIGGGRERLASKWRASSKRSAPIEWPPATQWRAPTDP